MNRKELLAECKKLGMKGYSKMRKEQLETLLHIKQTQLWFDDIIVNGIVQDVSFSDLSGLEIGLNDVIELKEDELTEKPKKTKKIKHLKKEI